MIDISNLRIEEQGDWIRLVADISSDFKRWDNEKNMWFSVKKENASMFCSDTYNPFLLFPVFMAMYYSSDIHLHGSVSKQLYKNVRTYLWPILKQFSDDLQDVKIIVDGFCEIMGKQDIVGTGISGGVDCLSTIYSYYQLEKDEEDKINGLFMLNCGWHGDYNNPKSKKLFFERCITLQKLSNELGIKFYEVDSNLHAFLNLGDRSSYFMIYSCVFALEGSIKKYYMASSLSYQEILKFNSESRNIDWSEYADPYALPLIKSENLEFISDGCQFTRSQKTERISNWPITRKYLNVCCANDSAKNCSVCHKCVRTLLPLEAMGKLDEFSKVFDIEKYKKVSFQNKCRLVIGNGKIAFLTDNYEYCRNKGMKLPSKVFARIGLLHAYIDKILIRIGLKWE